MSPGKFSTGKDVSWCLTSVLNASSTEIEPLMKINLFCSTKFDRGVCCHSCLWTDNRFCEFKVDKELPLLFEYSVLSSVEREEEDDDFEIDLCSDSVSLLFASVFLSVCSLKLFKSVEFGNWGGVESISTMDVCLVFWGIGWVLLKRWCSEVFVSLAWYAFNKSKLFVCRFGYFSVRDDIAKFIVICEISQKPHGFSITHFSFHLPGGKKKGKKKKKINDTWK